MKFRIPILYNLFYKLSKFFFYRSLSYDDGIRGIAIFGPEPSYYGIIAIYYLTFLEWAKIKGLIRENKYYYINILIIIFCSILTKSTYSILFIALFILYKVKLRKIVLLAPIFIIYFLLNKNIYQSRAVEALKNIIEAKNLSLKEKLFYADGSVGARFFLNSLGYNTFLMYPLGLGLSSFEEKAVDIGEELGYDFNKQPHFRWEKEVKGTYQIGAQTYFSKYIFEFGIFGIPLMLFLINKITLVIFYKKYRKFKLLCYTSGVIMLIIMQGQLSNPIPWIMISFVDDLSKKGWINENINRL